ncbi:PP2C-like domain-containing protein CG9801 [Teleopsis dalmanni]|uniref:PP2C-like domain-containing protein CG9801 n=1 Tax=Teleopsis dalmanni TaxID=139649 RepID=UPI000D32A0C6|nr:PP2C-like domain-containing protein CG9801 [Teleopsis dalmanni]XP_037948611.1 PP2C-like domain-containing protein CG9801 [Teleopsis dalmanni]XP_037948612.1 PP2C-like domain-containing protein CG9801 [Teleopsis dalmanni]XP_037948613.1 PP2C-like domain-containing protein CG9801 [Teleopsis dalmanni]XP_037948614.1 PP2C-like domain-containing protein CG9801 [Teleopsis dalmanni]
MPSLRQKVTTYFRQLSFIAEPRDGQRSSRKTEDDGNFIIKYLEGRMNRIFSPCPEIFNGQNPTDLPELKIGSYATGPVTITAACTGPDDGLTGIKRSKLHLTANYADDIDFIDTIQESDCFEVRKSITTNRNHSKLNRFNGSRKLSNGAITPTSDQNANKMTGMRSRKNSKTGIANLSQNINSTTTKDATKTTSITSSKRAEENSNAATTIVVSMVSTKTTHNAPTIATHDANDQNNKNILNGKTEFLGNKDVESHTKTTLTNSATVQTKDTMPLKSGFSNLGSAETTNILEATRERLLREAVSNQAAVACNSGHSDMFTDSIASVSNWKMETDYAYGISVSLYENNILTKEPMGNPIADCYGMVVHGDAVAMALADGVNWGDGARLAARSAVHGCLDYLDRAIFGLSRECVATSTHEVFISLLRSLWEGHGCILEVGGALSTLTIAVVLPLADNQQDEYTKKYVVCACNVGDSLGYVYSKKYGVREFTQASHDISSMRDMRDALGALGPADGNKPELSNLTLSMTIVEKGDIVFLTSDGVSDNFDPVVGKFAEAWTPDVKLMSSSLLYGRTGHIGVLAPKRQNKSTSAVYAHLHRGCESNSPIMPPVRPPRTKKSNLQEMEATASGNAAPSRPKYMRSQTVIEPRRPSSAGNLSSRPLSPTQPPKIPKSVTGLPLVTGPQRHALTLYRLEDLLSYGINGTFSPCVSARRLCHLLIDFVRMITSARRKTLEQRELFYKLATGPDGVKREVELNRMQHRAARKRIVDSNAFGSLPGKLDHATVLAYTIGGAGGGTTTTGDSCLQQTGQASIEPTTDLEIIETKEFQETNF